VVVVDDDNVAILALETIVRQMGHQVIARHDASDMLTLLLNKAFDLAFIDIGLQGTHGNVVAEVLKRTKAGQRTPLILISSLEEKELAEKARAAGADDWMRKPIRAEAVRAMITKHVGSIGK
jgi:CheY-like chemotaxis protein